MERNLGWCLALGASILVGCANANNQVCCIGGLVADLSGELPVFSMDGESEVDKNLTAVPATALEVRRCGGDVVWFVSEIDDQGWPVTYGVVPANAAEDGAAEALEDGATYAVAAMSSRGVNGGYSVGSTLTFTWGPEPEIVEDCP